MSASTAAAISPTVTTRAVPNTGYGRPPAWRTPDRVARPPNAPRSTRLAIPSFARRSGIQTGGGATDSSRRSATQPTSAASSDAEAQVPGHDDQRQHAQQDRLPHE